MSDLFNKHAGKGAKNQRLTLTTRDSIMPENDIEYVLLLNKEIIMHGRAKLVCVYDYGDHYDVTVFVTLTYNVDHDLLFGINLVNVDLWKNYVNDTKIVSRKGGRIHHSLKAKGLDREGGDR